MPLYTTDALVLRTYQLGEADRIVVFLTRDRGKRRGVANGARRPRSRFGGGLEPLTLTRLAYFERERRDLVRLSYVEPSCSPLMAGDGNALGYVEYFAELLDECVPEGDPNPALFRLGAAVVEALLTSVPIARLARYFEYWVLRLQGVYPSLAMCQQCGGRADEGGRVDPVAGGFSCRGCTDNRGIFLSGEAVRFLWRAAATPPGRLSDVELSEGAARELEHAHRGLIAAHLEKELRSARVLKAMER